MADNSTEFWEKMKLDGEALVEIIASILGDQAQNLLPVLFESWTHNPDNMLQVVGIYEKVKEFGLYERLCHLWISIRLQEEEENRSDNQPEDDSQLMKAIIEESEYLEMKRLENARKKNPLNKNKFTYRTFEEQRCPICFLEVTEGYYTKCEHMMCVKCLQSFLETNVACHICRENLE